MYILPGIEEFGENNTSSRDVSDKQRFYKHFSQIRQSMLDHARSLNVDGALILDSDTLVGPDLLTGLLAQNKDVCGSICFVTELWTSGTNPLQLNRHINAMNRVIGSEDDYIHWFGYTGNACSRVNYVGGVYLLSKAVLDADIRYPETPHRYGEDLYFCRQISA